MAVIQRIASNCGTLEFVCERTGLVMLRLDPTAKTITIPAGVKVVHEDDTVLPDGKVSLDALLGELLNS